MESNVIQWNSTVFNGNQLNVIQIYRILYSIQINFDSTDLIYSFIKIHSNLMEFSSILGIILPESNKSQG